MIFSDLFLSPRSQNNISSPDWICYFPIPIFQQHDQLTTHWSMIVPLSLSKSQNNPTKFLSINIHYQLYLLYKFFTDYSIIYSKAIFFKKETTIIINLRWIIFLKPKTYTQKSQFNNTHNIHSTYHYKTIICREWIYPIQQSTI